MAPTLRPGRAARLKAATTDAHERLDRRIMELDPFASRLRYAAFVQVQHGFHTALAPLYADHELGLLIPDLTRRSRLDAIEADLADLDRPLPPPAAALDLGPAAALGWLYVAEGSSLGAAILLRHAAALKLRPDFGARHLAGHEAGRSAHWRSFTAALDAAPLAMADDDRMIEAARDAFARFRALAERELG
ncbi:heme oxygenase [Sphingomonas metalli]|uniref:Heme oxygenase n=1 Tax=Sphingomonas metalli TaxID=1779358 RepID=A0A916T938_9SPHN|nr:biliverdin-producing heme oxygenase [Sphingomonas metalli]GGB36297.1 heme oxygenase [Sphingomonas metalli]